MRVAVEADGGSRGNPGPAGYGAVVRSETGEVLAERLGALGITTNNVAEYSGLIAGLKAAAELGADEVDVRMDSKLVVEQMSGRWQIKHAGLQPLAAEAAELARRFRAVRYSWIPRAQNSHADRLANAAMDGAVAAPPSSTLANATKTLVNASETLVNATALANVSAVGGPEPATIEPGAESAAESAAGPGAESAAGPGAEPATEPGAEPATEPGAEPATEPGAEPAAVGPAVRWAPPDTGAALRMVLIRHGETAHNAEKRYSGRGDIPLSDRGREQAVRAAARARAVAPELALVVSSPLQRCLQTAAAFGDLPVVVDEDLIECDFGAWEGLTFGEVRAQYPAELDRWLASAAVAPPGGESFQQVTIRVRRAIRRLQEQHAGRQIAVVSHVTPIKLLLRDALAAGDAFLHRLYLDSAGLSIVDSWPDGGVAVRAVNETAHLLD